VSDDPVVQRYPAWRYHATEPAVVVENAEADERLGDGWFDSPALTKPAKAAKKTEEPAEEPEPEEPHHKRRK